MDNINTVVTIPEPVEKKKRGRKKKSETAATETKVVLVAVPKKKNYLNNADLMKELAKSKERDKMTDELAKMLTMLCDRYAKHPDYLSIYSYVDDMKAFAMMTIVKVWRSFNAEKTNNPFAYFTQVIRHAFYQYLNHETRQRTIKDEVLVNMGEQPSFNYLENHYDRGHEHDMGTEVTYKSYESGGDTLDDHSNDD